MNIDPSLARIPQTSLSIDRIKRHSSTFVFSPISETELGDVVNKLKSTAPGHDELKSSLLKKCLPYISKPLLHIFNLSIRTGVFPDQLQWAKVIPLFKADDPSLFSNYRPNSILPCFSKVLKKLVYKSCNFFYIFSWGRSNIAIGITIDNQSRYSFIFRQARNLLNTLNILENKPSPSSCLAKLISLSRA